jgi:predicted secreted protein
MKDIVVQGPEYSCEVELGEQFNLVLTGNATTGYGWYLHNVDNKLSALNMNQFNSGEYVTDIQDDEEEMCGAPGKFHFKFEALEVGEAELEFVYERPWNKELGKKTLVKIHIK